MGCGWSVVEAGARREWAGGSWWRGVERGVFVRCGAAVGGAAACVRGAVALVGGGSRVWCCAGGGLGGGGGAPAPPDRNARTHYAKLPIIQACRLCVKSTGLPSLTNLGPSWMAYRFVLTAAGG